ncbi:circularly permuted type 2 ATP-grasp protein [Paludibaculum fermentans]|uniref:circularly permuted type 2 ATP-grasp protein n=1 Tax=Paludibaculum fermentans TaxID=1473598 RepID=UPI003EC05283
MQGPKEKGSCVAQGWDYSPNEGYYDELATPQGATRLHWRALMEALKASGPEDLASRWKEAQRLIRDNGVTYNVYGDPHGTDRPWPLDPVPMVIDPQEWAGIETAVAQRASLLNSILEDLYGPQRLLNEGLLPPELVYANPGFLRSCHGIKVPGDIRLHLYAADLARSPDGQWWVLSDRTQSPSGAGYALENRLVSTRTLPDLFRKTYVRRLANFFLSYRETLMSLAPGHRENPRIVLLTPGPYNETYFEHAFLARYLGYTLVEGGDLTVRDRRVYLKTLGGLLPVDMILRRQDDGFCDPLELRGDSMLGVPGLVEAVRAGTVAIANALGSGAIETAALSPFLPGLSRQILGEELKMPSVANWWCGQEKPLAYVTENLARLVVKQAFPGSPQEPIFGGKISAAEREKLAARIRATPYQYVAQEQVALSTVPVWTEEGLHSRHLVMRVYAVPSGGGYKVMPGGLTRVSSSLDTMVVSVQRGGGSKDTWVLGRGQEKEFSLLKPSSQTLEVSRATFDLPSRVADNLFWLGRYMERVDSTVRLARSALPLLSQETDAASATGLQTAVGILTALHFVRDPVEADGAAVVNADLVSMIFDSDRRYSIGRIVHEARRLAWLLRDRISADAWRILNRLDNDFCTRRPAEPFHLLGATDLLDQSIITLAAFSGLVMDGMTRGQGWRFLDIGRRIERASQLLDVLRHGLGDLVNDDSGRLAKLLEIADSSITYRSRYLTTMQSDLVIDLLLCDEANPRSVAFQFARLSEHIAHLPDSGSLSRRSVESRLILSLLSSVQLAETGKLMEPDGRGEWTGLLALLDRLAAEIRALSSVLSSSYFSHAIPSQQLRHF